MGKHRSSHIPSRQQRLDRFTNRVKEVAHFRQAMTRPPIPSPQPTGDSLPVLTFWGISGNGKTSLLERLDQVAIEAGVPSVYVNLEDIGEGFSLGRGEPAGLRAISEGLALPTPTFTLAYLWWRYRREELAEQPKMSGIAGTGLETVKWLFDSGNPTGPIGAGLLGKLAEWTGLKKLGNSKFTDWIKSAAGQKDHVQLSAMEPDAIQMELAPRLIADVKAFLDKQKKFVGRPVALLDTFEVIRRGHAQDTAEKRESWVHDFCDENIEQGSPLLIVIAGRDRIRWDQPGQPFAEFWSQPEHLDQTPVGGLSKEDATEMLGKYGTNAPAVVEAILRVCRDVDSAPVDSDSVTEAGLANEKGQANKSGPTNETGENNAKTEASIEHGHHPFALGLCAITAQQLRDRGERVNAATFDMQPGDIDALVDRFLRSFGDNDAASKHWITRLALPPRLDRQAALQFAAMDELKISRIEWDSLLQFSFMIDRGDGWWSLHSRMRDALRRKLKRDEPEWQEAYERWRQLWLERAGDAINTEAGLAWSHLWQLEPEKASYEWYEQANRARGELRMADHAAIIDWWDEVDAFDPDRLTPFEAECLIVQGNELTNGSLGNRCEELHEAIDCYATAQRVLTESAFPQNWAMTQNNLGTVYTDLSSLKDREVNLRLAIEAFNKAARVYTELTFPQDWAGMQSNLGLAFRGLAWVEEREVNLRLAIEAFEKALRVFRESVLSHKWAMAQNNLGAAYSDLSSVEDRKVNLCLAIEAYNKALRVRTESMFPQDWAATQNNLGNAYSGLSSVEDREVNLRFAIEAYEKALRVYTESAFPQNCAVTQNNLGRAYENFASIQDRGVNLRLAIKAYEKALRVRTDFAFPQHWAHAQNNLGTTYAALASVEDHVPNLRRAVACFDRSLAVYQREGITIEVERVEHNHRIMKAALEEAEEDDDGAGETGDGGIA